MLWDDLNRFAPRTKAVWETIGTHHVEPVLEHAPEWLVPAGMDQTNSEWGVFLNKELESGITNRERLLRYLITRSVVDQGSDIIGVEMWHEGTFSSLYEDKIPLLDDLTLAVAKYPQILATADAHRQIVTEARAEKWASVEKGRQAASYSPYMVDGQRGKGNTHWFLTARVFPTLFLAKVSPGGLTGHVFGQSAHEMPKEMARRLRNDKNLKDGLSWVMGDKACDLFAKWAIGSFRLADGLDCRWTPADCPIPMDQRIGRLMIRTGFMDEFYGVVGEMSVKTHGFEPKSSQSRPEANDAIIPSGEWFLTVMDFRRRAKVPKTRRPDALAWVNKAKKVMGLPEEADVYYPQDVVSLLCRAYSENFDRLLTPVEIDDFFMAVGGADCKDHDPTCGGCRLRNVCQANNDIEMSNLKYCYT
ncbi:MAG: hypothetical protein JW384_01348 [Nitrosomonadaceae bacterium]|nr:hypothetical protein [Nitrosomonadaceae bacterium]